MSYTAKSLKQAEGMQLVEQSKLQKKNQTPRNLGVERENELIEKDSAGRHRLLFAPELPGVKVQKRLFPDMVATEKEAALNMYHPTSDMNLSKKLDLDKINGKMEKQGKGVVELGRLVAAKLASQLVVICYHGRSNNTTYPGRARLMENLFDLALVVQREELCTGILIGGDFNLTTTEVDEKGSQKLKQYFKLSAIWQRDRKRDRIDPKQRVVNYLIGYPKERFSKARVTHQFRAPPFDHPISLCEVQILVDTLSTRATTTTPTSLQTNLHLQPQPKKKAEETTETSNAAVRSHTAQSTPSPTPKDHQPQPSASKAGTPPPPPPKAEPKKKTEETTETSRSKGKGKGKSSSKGREE